MVQIPDSVKSVIEKYLAALKEHHIPIQHVFLFGSYATGNYTEWSDIDLALISDAFDGIRIDDRKKIRPITLSISSEIEVLPYTPDHFTSDDPFVKEILETGVKII